jgi:hypothetical protein
MTKGMWRWAGVRWRTYSVIAHEDTSVHLPHWTSRVTKMIRWWMKDTKHYLLTAYNRHTWLRICLVSTGTKTGCKARLVMLPCYSSVFTFSFSTASTVVCLLPFPDFQDSSTPDSLTIWDAGRYKPHSPNTPLQSFLARNNLISYKAVLTVRSLETKCDGFKAVSAIWSVFKSNANIM